MNKYLFFWVSNNQAMKILQEFYTGAWQVWLGWKLNFQRP